MDMMKHGASITAFSLTMNLANTGVSLKRVCASLWLAIAAIADQFHAGLTIKTSRVRTRFNRKTNLVYQRHKKEYEQIPEIISNIRHTDKIKATVLLLSGCQDGQESEDGKRNGQFTRALLRAYNKGSFRGGYEGLMASMVRMMPDYQTPNLSVIGRKNPEFVSSRPFKK